TLRRTLAQVRIPAYHFRTIRLLPKDRVGSSRVILDRGKATRRRGGCMRRRDFIRLAALGAAWPLAARGEEPKLPVVLVLGSTPAAWSHWLASLLQRLRELGWIENRAVTIDYLWTEGRRERFTELGLELARRKADVIVALGTPAIIAA